MSWFPSWFSSSKPTSAPEQSPNSTVTRLLEENPPQPATSSKVEPPQQPVPQTTQAINPHRNKIIFGAGLAFFAFSALVTKRSFARKRLASNPAFYSNAPGHQADQAKNVNGAMEALEALNIATINVLSFAMMAGGGALWYFDINSMAEARRKLRGGLGVDGTGRSEQDAEEEFEEWMATVLARKESKTAKAAPTNERGQER